MGGNGGVGQADRGGGASSTGRVETCRGLGVDRSSLEVYLCHETDVKPKTSRKKKKKIIDDLGPGLFLRSASLALTSTVVVAASVCVCVCVCVCVRV